MTTEAANAYALGYTDAEHLRLVRQARLLAPFTERLFRDAGVGTGMRVLDLGCGMGDACRTNRWSIRQGRGRRPGQQGALEGQNAGGFGRV
jgi:hypothetical protein